MVLPILIICFFALQLDRGNMLVLLMLHPILIYNRF
jgi:hypothetical protein